MKRRPLKTGQTFTGTTCGVCSMEFPSVQDLKQHQVDVEDCGKVRCCDLCGEKVGSLRGLVNHRVSGNCTKYMCPLCRHVVKTRGGLALHIKNMSCKLWGSSCRDCGRMFRCNQGLANHRSRKTCQLLNCIFCGKSFNHYSHMEKHMTSHTGEKRFICQHCTKELSTSSSMRRHSYTCKGQRFVNLKIPGESNCVKDNVIVDRKIDKHRGECIPVVVEDLMSIPRQPTYVEFVDVLPDGVYFTFTLPVPVLRCSCCNASYGSTLLAEQHVCGEGQGTVDYHTCRLGASKIEKFTEPDSRPTLVLVTPDNPHVPVKSYR